MRHPAPLHPHGALAVTLATHAGQVGARAVQVGARCDALPHPNKTCGERDPHITHFASPRREGGR
eukprot:4903722-Prymnesium_polylepis.1